MISNRLKKLSESATLEMARKIIEGNMIEKKIQLEVKEDHKNSNTNKLINISENLKKLIK